MEYTRQSFSPEELVNTEKNGCLKINEEYQRGAEWTQSQMQGSIDSIYRKYPIPPVFSHQIRDKGLGGHQTIRYEIVNGQQRIRALADYHSGKFALLDAAIDKNPESRPSHLGRP